jgi:RNA polymerase sigma factor (sigma-70 family)
MLFQAFDDLAQFLTQWQPDKPGCLVLDLDPGIPVTQEQVPLELLRSRGISLPVILTTRHGGLDACRRAFQDGAMDFLIKPVDEQALLEGIGKALQKDQRRWYLYQEAREFREQLALLSEREKQVLDLMLQGLPNKLIAQQIGLSTRTVESHRSRIYQKLQADSLAQLVSRVVRLEENLR